MKYEHWIKDELGTGGKSWLWVWIELGDSLIVYLEVCQFHNVLLTAKAEKSVKAKIVYIGKDITTKVSFKIKKDSIIN